MSIKTRLQKWLEIPDRETALSELCEIFNSEYVEPSEPKPLGYCTFCGAALMYEKENIKFDIYTGNVIKYRHILNCPDNIYPDFGRIHTKYVFESDFDFKPTLEDFIKFENEDGYIRKFITKAEYQPNS